MAINVAHFETYSEVNGPGLRSVVWVQGCTLNCPGCANQKLQENRTVDLIEPEELLDRILQAKTEGVTFSGGEPFQQASQLAVLAALCRRNNLSVISFSGHYLRFLKSARAPSGSAELLSNLDVLIDGPYQQHRAIPKSLRGSSNQSLHFLTNRYSDLDFQTIKSQAIISGDTVVSTGIVELEKLDLVLEMLGIGEKNERSKDPARMGE